MAEEKMTELKLMNPPKVSLRLSERAWFWVCLMTLSCLVSVTAALNGISSFAWDSWSYFELSKTVFGPDFFRFNTYRSYFSELYSAAFPLGYPVVIAVVQLLAGQTPLAAVAINVVVVAVTWIMIIRLATQLGLTTVAGYALASSFVLWTSYLDEVFAGRSIPLALLLFLFAVNACLSRRFFLSGLCLGLAVLVRFDYMMYAFLFHAVAYGFLFGSRDQKKIVNVGIGFLIGILPWVLYSQTHFGKMWVSDNAWVAFSAAPAHVTDFPAKPLISAVDNPVMWVLRVFGGIVPLARSMAYSSIQFPMLALISVYFFFSFRHLNSQGQRIAILLFIALAVSVLPHLLIGYHGTDYYTPLFLCACGIMAYTVRFSSLRHKTVARFSAVLLISLVLSTGVGLGYMTRHAMAGIKSLHDADIMAQQIETLKICHEKTPTVHYIFMDQAADMAPRYGAVTGYKTAYIPLNFKKMPEEKKRQYLQHMKPYALIDAPPNPHACPVVH